RFRQQIAELEEGAAGLEDRRVVILTDTDPAARGPLRQKLRPRDFGIVLIDTDGTVVQRRPSVTTAREIMNLIDRLPSRRQETGSGRPWARGRVRLPGARVPASRTARAPDAGARIIRTPW